ncbi:LamG domain-containing protein [Bacteroides sp. 214]|uniref:LamG domain-containing protein n=1 Tax=Bacteroides sp. 214 TaxID=2302935 RepID=UPI0013D60519|nr:LamG domain-containing protein [Bacteroides sp. 214]NDW12150.1 LamG domain-containing protein [Bacteroides sp. 214]
MKRLLYLFCLLVSFSVSKGTAFAQNWILSEFIENQSEGVHYKGNPEVVDSPYGKAVSFDGIDDGIFLDQMPLAGLEQFTIEAIFKPESGGNFEQRFFHTGEVRGDRVLFELRATETEWYFDAYIKCGDNPKALIEPELKHPLDQWFHVAFVIDKGKLTTYVNGKKELEGAIDFSPIKTGKTSFGVRLNEQSWFKGVIKQIKITPKALDSEEFLM